MRGRRSSALIVAMLALGGCGTPVASSSDPVAEPSASRSIEPRPSHAVPHSPSSSPSASPSPSSPPSSFWAPWVGDHGPVERIDDQPSREDLAEFRVPERLELQVEAPFRDGERMLVVRLAAPDVAGGCLYAGPLEIDLEMSERADLRVRGYRFEDQTQPEYGCTPDVRDAWVEYRIDLAWLQERSRVVVVELEDHVNLFTLSLDRVIVTTRADRSSNVVFNEDDEDLREVETVVFPDDVGRLYAVSELKRGNSARALLEFAQDHGWLNPFEEYGLSATFRRSHGVYVVVRNRSLPPPGQSVQVGSLERGVTVHLGRA